MASDALRSQVAAKWHESFARLNRNHQGITGLVSFSEAWTLATTLLLPQELGKTKPEIHIDAIRAAFTTINAARRLPFLLETFLEDLKGQWRMIEKDVLEYMKKYEENGEIEVVRLLVVRLAEWFRQWAPLNELGVTIYSAYTLAFQTQLFSVLPPSFAAGFKALVASTLSEDTSPPEDTTSLWQAFESLGMIDRYESIIATVGYEFIEQHVIDTCSGEWPDPMLDGLRNWMSEKVVPWMLMIYARGANNADEARAMLQGVGSRFDFHINKTLCDLRTGELFDIIIDFPDSTGALYDLRDCLQRVDQRSSLVKALRQANRKRLLHPGADTKLILTQYVSTIKCLRLIDPPGVLLYKIADPIRRYLRSRPDTIRSIVSNLVGSSSSDDDNDPDTLSLIDENEPLQPLNLPGGGGTGGLGIDDDYTDPNWDPEPIDAGPEFRTNKPSDVLSTLVSIYDSKDLFVRELQVLLAQRLLAITFGDESTSGSGDGRVERERKNVEILKVRFGEAALGVCEVMLRDMGDTRRVDMHVQSVMKNKLGSESGSVVHPTIISHHFWPALESSEMVMPGQFQTLQQEYSKEFETFKPDKKLKWLPHLGTVKLELELKDRKVEVEVPPLEAAFIELFSQKDIWTLDELIAGVGSVDRGAALKALLTWIDHGVITEDEENVFRLLEEVEDTSAGPDDEGGSGGGVRKSNNVRTRVAAEQDGGEGSGGQGGVQPTVSAAQVQAEQMRVYWKFIEGMLTNLGGLPIDRIQSMLKFAPGYDQSLEQLSSFLELARREGVVICKDGVWKLNK